MNVVQRLMATHADIVFVCLQGNGQSPGSRSNILSGSWRGNWLCFFFFFSSTPKSPAICWLSCKCVCGCMHLFSCTHGFIDMHWFVSVFCVFFITPTSRSGSSLQGTPGWKQTKTNPVSSFFPAHVWIHYISRWERTDTAEQRAFPLHKGTQQSHRSCSLQEGSGWREWKNT